MYVVNMTTQPTANGQKISLRDLRFGIEIETIGATRRKVANAIARVVGGTVRHIGAPSCYDPYEVRDARGRIWKVMADSSLNASFSRQAEVVSPILVYTDIPELQEVVRAVRRAGAKVDESTGIHIHVDGERFSVTAVSNLLKMFRKQEEIFMRALGVSDSRRQQYCQNVDPRVLARIEQAKPKTKEELNRAWYGSYISRPTHYDRSRYHAVNVHSLFFLGTIEFRAFNSTLHAGKVKAYIQFALALSAKAINARSASSKKRSFNAATAKYDLRVVLLSLGMIGDEFKTARKHLMGNLQGSAAWKNGRPQRGAA